jgi:hypothetical protein
MMVAADSPLHLAHRAKTLTLPGDVRFSCTHHTKSQQWCFQALLLNIVHMLSTYMQTVLSTLLLQTQPQASCSLRTPLYGLCHTLHTSPNKIWIRNYNESCVDQSESVHRVFYIDGNDSGLKHVTYHVKLMGPTMGCCR